MYFEVAQVTASIPVLLAWGVVVGLVFSTVGAAGGILASFGLITVFALPDANQVKPMAQALTLITPLIAVPLYIRQCRVMYLLAGLLGAGGIIGAVIGSSLSTIWLADMSLFKPVFAVLVLFIAGQIGWQLIRQTPGGSELSNTMRAAEAFESHVKKGGDVCDMGVKLLHTSWSNIIVQFGNEEFAYRPWLPFLVGMAVAVLSSALGVGGGFLLVPFMSIVMGLPMYVIAGTSALAILVHSVTSIGNYVRLGVELDYALLGLLMAGVVVGSLIGPIASRYIAEKVLRVVLCLVLIFIGFRYIGLF